MKKILSIFIITIIICNLTVFASGDISIYLDGKAVSCDPPPMIINNRTMIPVRAVFEAMGAGVEWVDNTRTVKIKYKDIVIEMTIDSDSAIVNGVGAKMDSPAVIVSGRTLIPLRFVGETIGATVSWDGDSRTVKIASPKGETPPIIIENVEFKKMQGYDCLTMTTSGKTNVKTMILTNPTRLVLDIQNALLTGKNTSYTGGCVSAVRVGAHDGYVRFVAESKNVPGFIISDNGGMTQILLFEQKKNFDYIGMDECKMIFKDGVNIKAESYSDNKIVFSASGNLLEEFIYIGDELIDSINVSGNIITVNLKKKTGYNINGNTIIFNKNDGEDNHVVTQKTGIVVLDAGHGGKDPGTVGYGEDGKTIIANEKDMNLTLVLMVNEILVSQNVKTVLTRNNDVYIGLKERADIANDCNAELFVSIHNNSIPDPSYKGSMVLYSLDSTGGKILASNILKEMTESAGTENKGLRDGSNMSVIRNTKMPAVIVECGCLTNAEELGNLMDVEFLHKLAEGIAEGILISLGR